MGFASLVFGLFSAIIDMRPSRRPSLNSNVPNSEIEAYFTSADQSLLFQKIPINFNTYKKGASNADVTLNPDEIFQTVDGFGCAITGSTAYNLLKMDETTRHNLLVKTFDPVNGMGHSAIRISIGCSDFSLEDYTYCDKEGIENFAIHELDKRDLIPILKQILTINPNIKIIASPWTCPRWMKITDLTFKIPYRLWFGGHLHPKYYQDYATYFVKYIQAMKAEGINIYAITVQNEVLNSGNSASLYMGWEEQRDFIKNALGPAFTTNGIKTKIIVFDHNYNYDDVKSQDGYPLHIYEDADASKYCDGAAYHAYGGDKKELDRIREAYPDKNLYFTEISIGEWSYTFESDLMWNMREVGIGTLNKGTKVVLVWNLLLDDQHGPYRPKGCTNCYGAIDVNHLNYSDMKYNSHYYTMSHLAKVIKNGAVRIATNEGSTSGLYYTAFKNPDGSLALVAQNDNNNEIDVTVNDGKKSFSFPIPQKTIASLRWND
ncbi:glucosylceramidase [Histomonas meleagridis]|uniref:glucosylceramidase n=1 Tax=Histomonas meleagridis TaxID=135588 RepID=UPI0035594FEC|nr:glucosylceramidase [Histomonas meleagridis]KAH0804375.1 glucosylceramidase [Histomonas meleagridis]